MTNMLLLLFRRCARLTGMPTALAMLSLSAAGQPTRSAFDILERNPTLIPALFNGDKALFTRDSPAAMLVTNSDNIRGRLAIKIVIGSEDGLLKWTEQLHTSMVKLKISHEVEIVGGVGHDFGAPAMGIYEHQLRGLRYAADHFVLPQP